MDARRENSRKKKRKEARQARNQLKFQSWCDDQKERRTRKEKGEKRKVENCEQNFRDWDRRKRLYETCSVSGEGSDKIGVGKKRERGNPVSGSKKVKVKTKFEEYLEMDGKADDKVALNDLKMERRLAKRLKVKDGKLGGVDDGFNKLFNDSEAEDEGAGHEELSENSDADVEEDSAVDATGINSSLVQEEALGEEDGSQGTSTKVVVSASCEKYVPRHLRSAAMNESQEHILIRRKLRGLRNKLHESEVESVTKEIAIIYRSVSRSVGTRIICNEVVEACSAGTPFSEQQVAAFAAFVAGMACSVGIDFSAKLVASLAKCFQDEYHKEDQLSQREEKTTLRNLTLLLSYLYIFGVCSSDLIYDFLSVLSKQLNETDVYAILKVLNYVGMKIRADDPASMKNFVQTVQSRVNELKKSRGEEQANALANIEMERMLATILDIKNNKKRPKEESPQHTRIKKWLQKLHVDNIVLRGLKWSKLLDPEKKGQWWLSGDVDSTTDDVEEVANTIDREAFEAQKLLQLAASLGMNTGARTAILCIIMSAEDYLDAYEKLLRLDLQGTQERDIIRVLVVCCLREKVFNKYYIALANHLCENEKNHKFTLQYCIWDHFKELESMPSLRSMHLARFVAEMVSSFTLSLAVLKSVELSDAGQLTAKGIVHFQTLFEFLLEKSDQVVWNVFTRVAIAPDLEALRHGIEFFVKEWVVPSNKAMTSKYKLVKKALSNSMGVLM